MAWHIYNIWLLEIAMTNLNLNVEPKGLVLSIGNIMNQGMMILALNFTEKAEEGLNWSGGSWDFVRSHDLKLLASLSVGAKPRNSHTEILRFVILILKFTTNEKQLDNRLHWWYSTSGQYNTKTSRSSAESIADEHQQSEPQVERWLAGEFGFKSHSAISSCNGITIDFNSTLKISVSLADNRHLRILWLLKWCCRSAFGSSSCPSTS